MWAGNGPFLVGYRVKPGGVGAAYRNTNTVIRVERGAGLPQVDIELVDLAWLTVNEYGQAFACYEYRPYLRPASTIAR